MEIGTKKIVCFFWDHDAGLTPEGPLVQVDSSCLQHAHPVLEQHSLYFSQRTLKIFPFLIAPRRHFGQTIRKEVLFTVYMAKPYLPICILSKEDSLFVHTML